MFGLFGLHWHYMALLKMREPFPGNIYGKRSRPWSERQVPHNWRLRKRRLAKLRRQAIKRSRQHG